MVFLGPPLRALKEHTQITTNNRYCSRKIIPALVKNGEGDFIQGTTAVGFAAGGRDGAQIPYKKDTWGFAAKGQVRGGGVGQFLLN